MHNVSQDISSVTRELAWQVFDQISDPAWLEDSQGRYRLVNKAFCALVQKLTGSAHLVPEDIIGQTPESLAPQSILVRFNRLDDRVRESRRRHVLIEHTRVGQQDLFFEITKSPCIGEEGEVIGTIGIVRDTTLHENQRRALRESENANRQRSDELLSLLHALPIPVWITKDVTGKVIVGNRAASSLLRLPPRSNHSFTSKSNQHLRAYINGEQVSRAQMPIEQALVTGSERQGVEVEVRFEDETCCYLLGNVTPLRDSAHQVIGAIAAFVDISELKEAQLTQQLLVREMGHRMSNTLATVIALARRTAVGRENVEEFVTALEGRLVGLARAQHAFSQQEWSQVNLRKILELALAGLGSYEGNSRIHLIGDPVELPSRYAIPLGLALYELRTNASKYGSLSVATGHIYVEWTVAESTLRIRWEETGGPTVQSPSQTSTGTQVIHDLIEKQLDGQVAFTFNHAGIRVDMSLPLGGE